MPTDRTRDEEVERLLGVGATHLRGSPQATTAPAGSRMLDPEGNEFCVERSQAEPERLSDTPVELVETR